MKSLLAKIWKALPLTKHLQLRIMRLTQDEFLIGVTGVILNDANEILVVNHSYRDGKRWSLPGGYIKGKEHPKEGLMREIEEETGFIVRIEEEVKIKTDRETARLDISFIGRHVGGELKLSHEILGAGFFAFENLPLLSQNQLVLIREVLGRRKKGHIMWKKLTGFLKRNKVQSENEFIDSKIIEK